MRSLFNSERYFFLFVFVTSLLVSCASPEREKKNTLFTEIESQSSGIDFVNELPFNKEFNIHTETSTMEGGWP